MTTSTFTRWGARAKSIAWGATLPAAAQWQQSPQQQIRWSFICSAIIAALSAVASPLLAILIISILPWTYRTFPSNLRMQIVLAHLIGTGGALLIYGYKALGGDMSEQTCITSMLVWAFWSICSQIIFIFNNHPDRAVQSTQPETSTD